MWEFYGDVILFNALYKCDILIKQPLIFEDPPYFERVLWLRVNILALGHTVCP